MTSNTTREIIFHFCSLDFLKMDNLDETKIAAIPTLGDSVAFTTSGKYSGVRIPDGHRLYTISSPIPPPHAEFGPNYHWEDAPHFTKIQKFCMEEDDSNVFGVVLNPAQIVFSFDVF